MLQHHTACVILGQEIGQDGGIREIFAIRQLKRLFVSFVVISRDYFSLKYPGRLLGAGWGVRRCQAEKQLIRLLSLSLSMANNEGKQHLQFRG